ncbi:MAG: amidohydrolase family protein [Candidatus Binatia bacterium]
MTVFDNALLWDGSGAPPSRAALCVVEERIAEDGACAGAVHVDLGGAFVVPGLIDTHVHVEREDDLPLYTRLGVTTVLAMVETLAEAQRLEAASRRHPDWPEITSAAPIFTARSGWWDESTPRDAEVDRFPGSAAEAEAAVDRAAALGARRLKVMLDDMRWCRDPEPRLARMKPEVFAALADAARRHGLPLLVHAVRAVDVAEAVAGGTALLAHGPLESPLPAEVESAIAARGIAISPTLGVYEFLADLPSFLDRALGDPRLRALVPEATIARYRSAEYAASYAASYPNQREVARLLPELRAALRRLAAAGAPIVLGTDMWAFPGTGVHLELEAMATAGLDSRNVLLGATARAATALGLADRGVLVAGRRADFVVLEPGADPLRDVRELRAIAAVYRGGRRVHP